MFAGRVICPTYVASLTILSRNKVRGGGCFRCGIRVLSGRFQGRQERPCSEPVNADEKQRVKALLKMAEKATDKQLKEGFLDRLDQTRTHVQRLEEVFRMHGAEIKAVNCPAIDGIIEEADEVAGKVADREVLDAALINAVQAAEQAFLASAA